MGIAGVAYRGKRPDFLTRLFGLIMIPSGQDSKIEHRIAVRNSR
jgi:hypothetical protein